MLLHAANFVNSNSKNKSKFLLSLSSYFYYLSRQNPPNFGIVAETTYYLHNLLFTSSKDHYTLQMNIPFNLQLRSIERWVLSETAWQTSTREKKKYTGKLAE